LSPNSTVFCLEIGLITLSFSAKMVFLSDSHFRLLLVLAVFPFVCIKCKVFISCQVCDKLKMSAALLSFIQGSYRSGKAGKSWVISLAKGKSGKFNLESQGIAHD